VTAAPGRVTWLILAYRLPAHSGLKAVIRRKATALGAVYPANAVAALPASPAAERAFRRLRNMIGEGGRSAEVLRAEAVEGEPDLIATFNGARGQEYGEIIAGCGEIIAEIEAMTAAGPLARWTPSPWPACGPSSRALSASRGSARPAGTSAAT